MICNDFTANQDPMSVTTNQKIIEPDYVSSIASITNTFDEYPEQGIKKLCTRDMTTY